MIIYSALFGKYDRPYPAIPCKGVSWILFTDTPEVEAPGWTMHGITPRFDNPRTESKYWKTHPPYGLSVYIDSHVHVHDERFVVMASKALQRGDLCLWPHTERDCIYEEAEVCVRKKLDINALSQVNMYKETLGHPEHGGLWMGGVIARKSTSNTERFNNIWWSHILRFPKRDQLSLPVAIREAKIKVAPFSGTIANNEYVGIGGHRPW
jgi:hypothetical protein